MARAPGGTIAPLQVQPAGVFKYTFGMGLETGKAPFHKENATGIGRCRKEHTWRTWRSVAAEHAHLEQAVEMRSKAANREKANAAANAGRKTRPAQTNWSGMHAWRHIQVASRAILRAGLQQGCYHKGKKNAVEAACGHGAANKGAASLAIIRKVSSAVHKEDWRGIEQKSGRFADPQDAESVHGRTRQEARHTGQLLKGRDSAVP